MGLHGVSAALQKNSESFQGGSVTLKRVLGFHESSTGSQWRYRGSHRRFRGFHGPAHFRRFQGELRDMSDVVLGGSREFRGAQVVSEVLRSANHRDFRGS